MANVRATAIVISLVMAASAVGLTVAWRHQVKTRGATTDPLLSIAPPKQWGFYRVTGETQGWYPKGKLDHNTVTDRRQYGPVTVVLDHDVGAARKP